MSSSNENTHDSEENREASEDSPKRDELFISEGGQKQIFDPRTKSYVPVADIQKEIREQSTGTEPSREEIEAFLNRRTKLVQYVDLLSEGPRTSAYLPEPGGVGSGVFFKDGLFTFANWTAVYWYIVAPTKLGGNPRPLLYLTSSNHASKGPEALVSYQYDGDAVFRIWDWATPTQPNGSHFIVNLSYGHWGDHIITYNLNGQDHQSLYIANTTRRIGGTTWQNEVLLYNARTRTYDRVWSYSFPWNPAEREKYFGWGPIIETFEPYGYGTTNPVGYAEALLIQDGRQDVLTPTNSYIRNDNQGFEVIYLTPNYDLLAQ